MTLWSVCSRCNQRYDPRKSYDCPACTLSERAERILDTFRPNPKGIPASFRIARDGSVVPLSREEMEATSVRGYIPVEVPEPEEAPRDCKIPLGEQAQIYELRRMFRL